MGDIYHAGEVYAGSVPIDDTQASEDTVYSSAKVETMIDGVPKYSIYNKHVSLTPTLSWGGGYLTPQDEVDVPNANISKYVISFIPDSGKSGAIPLITPPSSSKVRYQLWRADTTIIEGTVCVFVDT